MKFLLVGSFAESLLNFRGALISALQQRGLEVHVAAPELPPGNPYRLQLEARGIVVHSIYMRRTGTNPVADLRTLFSIWGLMRRVRPRFVMTYTVKPTIYGGLAARFARVPHRFALITGLGYAFQEGKGRGWLRAIVQRLYAISLEGAQKVFFQNSDDEALFRRRGLLGPAKASCVVRGSGVDLEKFSASKISAKSLSFLLIARLLGDKGIREYVQAARKVRALYPEVRCMLAGWIDTGPDAIAQDELDAWCSDGSIEFLGRLSDVRPAIASCSVYVLPSYREGTPRTVLEAMAMGRAVITTDAPGCRDTVIEEFNGFLVPVKSVDSLVNAMLKFVADPSISRIMGEKSRNVAEEKYDVHKVNAIMLFEMGIQ
ncbi:glycosyltransferase family 4 protein [Variovorax paradoxus]|uniref:glycosyltransferase family 4 protein n=1 Tax=Variovorax TaxID=34072 RepID=UPI001ABC6862